MYQATQLKPGRKIIFENAPFEILKYDQHVMGRGSSVINVKMKNLLTWAIVPKSFGDSEKFEEADVLKSAYEYLYEDGENYYFMNQKNYEQVFISAEAVWDNKYFLVEWGKVVLQEYNWNPINIELEPSAELEVIETPPWEKWDTATGGKKPATLSTWLVVQVPLFINIWDIIKVDTRDKSYSSRA